MSDLVSNILSQDYRKTAEPAVALARAELNRRLARSTHFGTKPIDDAGWNMLMFLFAEHHRENSVAQICAAGLAPRTTSLRHLHFLARRGLVEFAASARDKRVRYARLTETASAAIRSYLEETAV